MTNFSPATSLRNSAERFARAGLSFDATFTRRLAEAATIHPEMYGHFAREQAKRAERLSNPRERGVGNGAPANQ